MLSKSQIKYIQSLKLKKYRQKYAQFFIEGDKIVKEAIAAQYPLKLLAATNNWLAANGSIIPRSIEIVETSEQQIKQTSSLHAPQQVIAIAEQREIITPDLKKEHTWLICLDNINDPGNLGTIIRSADWFGVEFIICSHDCADMFNPKVIQASMGSVFRVDVIYAELEEILTHIIMKKYATSLLGRSIYELNKLQEGVIIIGNESHGISPGVIALCDEHITIPSFGHAESLNAAVACSIILSHVRE
ncbi:MAG: RNA methyltransferase [Chitinophagales bacterium]|nr:RNA methyltransferase [Chitinophagales bacterium]